MNPLKLLASALKSPTATPSCAKSVRVSVAKTGGVELPIRLEATRAARRRWVKTVAIEN